MSDEKKGSGVLVFEVEDELRTKMVQGYQKQLEALGMKKNKVADLVAGFEDGWVNLRSHLKAMGVIVVVKREELEG